MQIKSDKMLEHRSVIDRLYLNTVKNLKDATKTSYDSKKRDGKHKK